jgi:hypothetical protein
MILTVMTIGLTALHCDPQHNGIAECGLQHERHSALSTECRFAECRGANTRVGIMTRYGPTLLGLHGINGKDTNS